ncbi:hypothetical protein [Haloterrigena alkaliphila]|uniref:RING-type E3 ubiquitin transferase n=1 Tax=Haloterrigena alkaliphila TaxID=2816475 RepID=A0A8A2VD02_9EURY|nr:hypothetical protein [Haloterrigena alkaliphila]QSW98324.1 hypothetical protein J0X25_13070 [Haloterrigena alkaliphila]
MPPTNLLVMGAALLFGLAVLAAGVIIASMGVGRIRLARRLRAAGPIPLREVPDANRLVEFAGTARASDEGTLEAPVSGTACLAYTVQSRSRDETRPDATWTHDAAVSAGVPFVVDEGTDRVRVDPASAVLSLTDRPSAATAWTDRADLSADVRDRLAGIGLPNAATDGDGADSSDDLREYREHREYREYRLEPGGDVHVYGGTVTDGADRASDPDAPVTVAGDDWFEVSVGDRPTVIPDRQRSGSLYVIFGGLLAVPGLGFTLAGIVGLVSTLVL